MNSERDELFEKLKAYHYAPGTSWEAPDGLRDAVFAHTRGTLRLRRMRRRAVYFVALLAVYGAGMATTAAISTPATQGKVAGAGGPVVEDAGTTEVAPEPSDDFLLDAERLALRLAEVDKSAQARLLREAADAYLRKQNFSTALTYYRQYLKKIEPAERERPDGNDSWLLMSLKQGYAQEVRYANSSSR